MYDVNKVYFKVINLLVLVPIFTSVKLVLGDKPSAVDAKLIVCQALIEPGVLQKEELFCEVRRGLHLRYLWHRGIGSRDGDFSWLHLIGRAPMDPHSTISYLHRNR